MSTETETAATHRAIDAVWRIESARIIAALARIVRDVGLAEELAQDALVAALEQWPGSGVPDNPGAWLMATAKHRALDHFRRSKLLERKHQEIGRELNSQQESAVVNFEAGILTLPTNKNSATIFSGCSSSPAIRYFRRKRALRLRCVAFSVDLPRKKSRALFWFPSRPSRSELFRAKRTLARACSV